MARIALSELKEINLAPETTEEDVTQSLAMIFGTPKGSVPYMREFGADAAFVDNRMTTDINDIADECFEQTETYEPRMNLQDVEQEADAVHGNVDIVLKYKVESEDGEEEEAEVEDDE
jgi:phage baseplate assembly protein W